MNDGQKGDASEGVEDKNRVQAMLNAAAEGWREAPDVRVLRRRLTELLEQLRRMEEGA